MNAKPKKKTKKRMPAWERQMMNEIHLKSARRIKERRQEAMKAVLAKPSFETYGDIYHFIAGLTPAQKVTLAARAILGIYTNRKPAEVLEGLQDKAVAGAVDPPLDASSVSGEIV